MPPPNPSAPPCVAIVADNPDTADGLQAYLENAGLATHALRALHDASAVPRSTGALVLFPDELDADVVVERLTSLRATRPQLLVLVVTSSPQRLRPALEPDGRSLLPLVLPKPAFGWTILDAIREHARPC